MSKSRHELLLLFAALFASSVMFLLSAFDLPKYNYLSAEIKSPSEAILTKVADANPASDDEEIIININTATQEELMTLDGIGEARSADIIEYREKNGRFRSIEELTDIKGIGQSILSKNAGRITV